MYVWLFVLLFVVRCDPCLCCFLVVCICVCLFVMVVVIVFFCLPVFPMIVLPFFGLLPMCLLVLCCVLRFLLM